MWIIQDWMSKRVFPNHTFDWFYQACGFIQEHADQTGKTEDEITAICEDLYAVEVMDPLDALLVETREQAQELAIHYQHWASEHRMSLDVLNEWIHEFEKLAEKFDLTDEFRENAII